MSARLTLTLDRTLAAHSVACFTLYRLLEVTDVTDGSGDRLAFQPSFVRDADERVIQLLLTAVPLPRPTSEIHVSYNGPVLGYSEVWFYVKDRISPEYSLLRDDSWAFPQIGAPSRANRLRTIDSKYTYHLAVAAPKGYVAAMGGRLESATDQGDATVFEYASKVPVWRLDISVAKFAHLSDQGQRFNVFALAGDEEGGKRVLTAMQRCLPLYAQWFGERSDFQGYTAIEIPADWGSQAADFYFMQTAAAFKSSEAIAETYHEIAHNWSPRATAEAEKARFFDEAFAQYFAALATRQLQGEKAFQDQLEGWRKSFVRRVTKDPTVGAVPIAGFGTRDIGYLSYTKGGLGLHLLHQRIGDDRFRALVRALLASPKVDFEVLRRLVREAAGVQGDVFLNDWIFGAASTQLLLSDRPLSDWK